MSRVLLLAPYRPQDTVLRRSRWVAGCNETRLRQEEHAVDLLEGDRCVAANIPSKHDGVAFFGHRLEDAVQGADERPLYGGEAARLLRDQWFHAFACDAAGVLGPRLIREGVRCFVGYHIKLTPKWDPQKVSPALQPALDQVVTCVTAALAGGEHNPHVLREALREAVDTFTLLADDHPGEDGGVRVFCEELLRGLGVLRGPDRPHDTASVG